MVDLVTDNNVCPVFQKEQEQAFVEPCYAKKRFICVGPKMSKPEEKEKPSLQCKGKGLHR